MMIIMIMMINHIDDFDDDHDNDDDVFICNNTLIIKYSDMYNL